jgi:heme exporter protein D
VSRPLSPYLRAQSKSPQRSKSPHRASAPTQSPERRTSPHRASAPTQVLAFSLDLKLLTRLSKAVQKKTARHGMLVSCPRARTHTVPSSSLSPPSPCSHSPFLPPSLFLSLALSLSLPALARTCMHTLERRYYLTAVSRRRERESTMLAWQRVVKPGISYPLMIMDILWTWRKLLFQHFARAKKKCEKSMINTLAALYST